MPQLNKQHSKIFPDDNRRESRSSLALTASNASVHEPSSATSEAFLVGYAASTNYTSHRTQNSSSANKSGSGGKKLSELARVNQNKNKSWVHKLIFYFPQKLVLCSLRTPLLCKLVFMLIVPLVAMVAISTVFVSRSAIDLNAQLHVDDAVLIAQQMAALSHSTASERTVSMLYITTNGTEYAEDRERIIQETQIALETALPTIVALKSSLDNARDLRVIEECESRLQEIMVLRQRVENLQLSRRSTYQLYTDLIATCTNVIDISVRSLNVASLTNQLISYSVFLTYKESVAQLQAKLVGVVRRNEFDDLDEYVEVVKLVGRREAIFDAFIDIATPAQRQVWRDFVNTDPLNAEFTAVLESIAHTPTGGIDYGWNQFYRNSTRMLRRYDNLETEMISDILSIQDRLTSEATGALVGVIVATLFVFVFTLCTIFLCAYCVWKPWAMVIKNREEMMALALDCADGIAKLDFSRKSVTSIAKTKDEDCTLLELAFKRIICNFQEFSQFLPQTLIAAVRAAVEQADDQNEELDKKRSTTSQKRMQETTPKGHNTSSKSLGSRIDSQATMTASTFSNKDSSRKMASTQPTTVSGNSSSELAQIRMNYGLQYRDITVMVVDIQNMHGVMNHCDSAGLCTLHADILNEFSEIVNRCKGVMHSFVGDKLIASWNSINSVIDREILACRAALHCSKALTNTLHPQWKSARLPLVECSFAVATGGTMSGNIGSSNQKGYVQFGSMMTRVWRMAKLVKSYGLDSGIIIDDATFQRVTMKFTARIIDVVQFKDVQHTSDFGLEKLYTLVSQKTMENDEWLYELDELEKQEEKGSATLVEAFECLIREDIPAAEKVIEAYRNEAEEALEENIETVERLEHYVEAHDNGSGTLFDLV